MLRSDAVTQGIQRSPNRAMLRAVGFGDADFGKPILGIANGFSTITPCNVGLDDLSRRAEEAARQARILRELVVLPWRTPPLLSAAFFCSLHALGPCFPRADN